MSKSVVVDVRRLDPELPLPTTAHRGDAGVDLHAREDAVLPANGGRVLVPTGLAVAIPVGYMGLVVPRSGLALKHGVTLVNTPGIIDSGYRVISNIGQHGHQEVPHLHMHVLGGGPIGRLVAGK